MVWLLSAKRWMTKGSTILTKDRWWLVAGQPARDGRLPIAERLFYISDSFAKSLVIAFIFKPTVVK